MRTWDRIRAGEWHRLGTGVEFARDPIVVIGDEVARMIIDGMKPEHPVCAPPWTDFVIEMQPSPWPLRISVTPDMISPIPTDTADFATGVALSFTDMTERFSHPHWRPDGMFAKMSDSTLRDGLELMRSVKEDGGWVLGLEMFADLPGGVLPIYWTAVVVDPDGQVTPMGNAWSFITKRTIEFNDEGPEATDPEWFAMMALLTAGLMTISLINCSNIGLADETPDYSRKERRRLARRDKPVVAFKRLQIHPHKSSRPTGHHDDAEPGAGVAIHIVRGHFKTYTAERPLLGKVVGTFWWQPQVRGTDAGHFVTKDYVVEGDGSE